MTKRYWVNGVNDILTQVLNGKRTIQQAKNYMEDHFVGDNRTSFNHAAYETTSGDITHELTVYNWLKDAVKMGFGCDKTLDRAFR